MYPRAVVPVKVGRVPVEPGVTSAMTGFVLLYLLALLAGTALMTLVVDGETAVSTVAATLGGVGPGFGLAGASESYALMPSAGKVILMVMMLLGRLEIYAFIALFTPDFWRR